MNFYRLEREILLKNTWKINEAKTHFSELVKAGNTEPQIITHHNKEVGVLLSYSAFLELQALAQQAKVPTIKESIQKLEQLGNLPTTFPKINRNNRKTWIDS